MRLLRRRQQSVTHLRNTSKNCQIRTRSSRNTSVDTYETTLNNEEDQQQSTKLLQKDASTLSSATIDIWTACKAGKIDTVREALKYSPELIHVTYQGRSPLYYACHCGHMKIVRILLDAGATDDELQTCYKSALNNKIRQILQQHRADCENSTLCDSVRDQLQTPVTSSSSSSSSSGYFAEDDIYHSMFDVIDSAHSSIEKIPENSNNMNSLDSKINALDATNPMVYSDSLLTERVQNGNKPAIAMMTPEFTHEHISVQQLGVSEKFGGEAKRCNLRITGFDRESSLMDSSMFENNICSAATKEEFFNCHEFPPSVISTSNETGAARTIEPSSDAVEVQETMKRAGNKTKQVADNEVPRKNRFLSFMKFQKKKSCLQHTSKLSDGVLGSNATIAMEGTKCSTILNSHVASASSICQDLHFTPIISINDTATGNQQVPLHEKNNTDLTSEINTSSLVVPVSIVDSSDVTNVTETLISAPASLSIPTPIKRDGSATSYGTLETCTTNDMKFLIPITSVPVTFVENSSHSIKREDIPSSTNETVLNTNRGVSIDVDGDIGVEILSATEVPSIDPKMTKEMPLPRQKGWKSILPTIRPSRLDRFQNADLETNVDIERKFTKAESLDEAVHEERNKIETSLFIKEFTDEIMIPDTATVSSTETSDSSVISRNESSITSSIQQQKSSLHGMLNCSTLSFGSTRTTIIYNNNMDQKSIFESTIGVFNCFPDNVVDDVEACTVRTMSFDNPSPTMTSISKMTASTTTLNTETNKDIHDVYTSSTTKSSDTSVKSYHIDELFDDTPSVSQHKLTSSDQNNSESDPNLVVIPQQHIDSTIISDMYHTKEVYMAEVDDETNSTKHQWEKVRKSSCSVMSSSSDDDDDDDDSFFYSDDNNTSTLIYHHDEKGYGCSDLFCG